MKRSQLPIVQTIHAGLPIIKVFLRLAGLLATVTAWAGAMFLIDVM